MNAEGELLHAYSEWHRLAQAETKAIQTRNWDLLNDCHLAVRDFQSHIAALTLNARAEWSRDGVLAEKEHNLQVMVSELIDLTRYNQGLLESTLTTARHHISQLSETGKNLKRLRRSYGVLPDWNQPG